MIFNQEIINFMSFSLEMMLNYVTQVVSTANSSVQSPCEGLLSFGIHHINF